MAGEGSRGGNVIGHTSTGKPVYAPKRKPHAFGQKVDHGGDISSYTPQDHADAHEIHRRHYAAADDHHDPRGRGQAHEQLMSDHRFAARGRKHALTKSTDPLSLIRGTGAMVAEFPEQVGSFCYASETETLMPGYQGGLFKGGGEGSRGGNVIGHTSSGKPIYGSALHPSHATFTPGEHREAAAHHESELRTIRSKPGLSREERAQARHHAKQWARHTWRYQRDR